MDKQQALNSFWNSFGIPAYDSTTVPDDSPLPYITYNVAVDDFGAQIPLNASIWYRDTSWAAITAKSNAVNSYIGRGGRIIKYDEGAFWIRKGSPFAQRMNDPEDDMIRRILLQVTFEFID